MITEQNDSLPKPVIQQRFSQKTLDRFWFNVAKSIDPDACWTWKGKLSRKGYSRFWSSVSSEGHVFSFKAFVGPVPEGKEVHHKCRNRACVNPSHLEALTHQSHCAIDFRRDSCPRGHLFVEGSYYEYRTRSGGVSRACRKCAAERSRKHYLDNRTRHNEQSALYYMRNKTTVSVQAKARYQGFKLAAAVLAAASVFNGLTATSARE